MNWSWLECILKIIDLLKLYSLENIKKAWNIQALYYLVLIELIYAFILLKISLAGCRTNTQPQLNTAPKNAQISTINFRLGCSRSWGTTTGSITVKMGVSRLTCSFVVSNCLANSCTTLKAMSYSDCRRCNWLWKREELMFWLRSLKSAKRSCKPSNSFCFWVYCFFVCFFMCCLLRLSVSNGNYC